LLKKNKNIGAFLIYLGIVLLLIFGLVKYGNFLPFYSSVVFEDYITYDDRINPPFVYESNWDIKQSGGIYGGSSGDYNDSKWYIHFERPCEYSGCSGLTLPSELNPWLLQVQHSSYMNAFFYIGSISFTTKEDLRGKDIKLSLTCSGGDIANPGGSWCAQCHSYTGGSCTVQIGNEVLDISNGDSGQKQSNLDIYSSKIDSNVADLYINGVFEKTLNFNGISHVNITLQSGRTLEINSFKTKIPFSCEIGPEQILAYEEFAGATKPTLNLYDLKYPALAFCLSECPTVCDSTQGGCTSENTCEIYQKLARGEILDIPSTQSWEIVYKIYNDASITQSCTEKYFDVKNNKCVNTTAKVHFCSGTLDTSTGTCYSNPEPICDGTLFTYPNGSIVCKWIAPRELVCEDPRTMPNTQLGICEFNIENGTCPAGFFIDSTRKKCYEYPLAKINCPQKCSFDPIEGYCKTQNGTICTMLENCPDGSKLINNTCVIYESSKTIISTNTLDLPLVGIVDATIFYILVGGLFVIIGILIYFNIHRRLIK